MSALPLERPQLVLLAHLVVGVGLAAFGLLLLSAGSVPGAAVNLALGAVVVVVGYRMSRAL